MIAFISDLHLYSPDASNTRAFRHFVAQYRNRLEQLYILGDLFDVCLGDDIPSAIETLVVNTLQDLHQAGVQVFFISGNRDFLIGNLFVDRAKINRLPDPSLISIYGQKALLMHGDSLCLADEKYVAYRKIVRNSRYQRVFLALPAFLRRWIGKRLREQSKVHNRRSPEAILDVTQAAVLHAFEQFDTTLLIHGHTHRMKVHNLSVKNKPCKRIVLGAWHDQGNGLICSPDGDLDLVYF